MTEFLKTLVFLSAAGSVLGLLLMLTRRVIGKRLPSTLWYYAWLPVLLRLALPVPGLIPAAQTTEQSAAGPMIVQTERAEENVFPREGAAYIASAASIGTVGKAESEAAAEPHIQWGEFLKKPGLWFAVWLLGAALCFARYTIGYARFRRALMRTLQTTDGQTARAYMDFDGRRKPRLLRSACVATPMLLGLFRPLIVLPQVEYSEESAENILRHELTHFKRGDLFVKWFFVLTSSLHWFNPLMPLFRRELDRVCELSCDETVLARMEPSQRRSYGETLLDLAANRTLPAGVVATTFSTEKRALRERLEQIMKLKYTSRAILALTLAALALTGAAALAAGPARASQAPDPLKEVSPEFPVPSDIDDAVVFADSQENGIIMTVNSLYWEEVDRELADFAHSGMVEVYVTEAFDETIPEDSILGPMTLEGYIYGTDGWKFSYKGELPANDPAATIKVRDADGRTLWIMEDADALYIQEADGSTTRVSYLTDPVDCADMIRHLLPWARGEYQSEEELRAEREKEQEAAAKKGIEELGYYGLPDLTPVNIEGHDEACPFWTDLSVQPLPTGPYVTLFYGTDDVSIDLHYERLYENGDHTRPLGAEAYEKCRSFFAENDTVTDVPRDSIRAFVTDGSVYAGPRIVWYDEVNDLLFSLVAHHCDDGTPLGSYSTEELIPLAQSVSRLDAPAFALLTEENAAGSSLGKTVEETEEPAPTAAPDQSVYVVPAEPAEPTEPAELIEPAADPEDGSRDDAPIREDIEDDGLNNEDNENDAPPDDNWEDEFDENWDDKYLDDWPGRTGETPIDYLVEFIPEEYWPAELKPDVSGEDLPGDTWDDG